MDEEALALTRKSKGKAKKKKGGKKNLDMNLAFHRESGKPLIFADVLYVLGLTKNLISISTLEDKGYHVKFRDHRVYIRPKGLDRSLDRVIGIRSGKVYRIHFEPAKALVSSDSSQGELWHRRMAHLHHGALRHLR